MLKTIVKNALPRLVGGSALAAMTLTFGCDDPPVPRLPTTLTLSPSSADFEDVTESVVLSATVTDQDGATMPDVTVHYVSSDQKVVSVNSSGMVTAKEEGTAEVWGFVRELQDTVRISVTLGPRGVLMRIYNALGGPDWGSDSNWGTTQPLDSWYGVSTDASGNVTQLYLAGNEVNGFIAPDIGMLEHLEELILNDNNGLAGWLPPEIGNLQKLRVMNFSSTGLRGSLPPEIGNLESLTEFRVVSPDFSPGTLKGPIPPEFGNLVNLEIVDFNGNELSGSIPPEMGQLRSLRQLNLRRNALQGPVPAEFGNLQNLTSLRIDSNPLSGALPGELTSLTVNRFHWHGTGLCAPAEASFKAWLESISDQRGEGDCEES